MKSVQYLNNHVIKSHERIRGEFMYWKLFNQFSVERSNLIICNVIVSVSIRIIPWVMILLGIVFYPICAYSV